MAEIIDLDSRRPAVHRCYTCGACASQVFVLQAGGVVRCGECQKVHTNLIWGQHFVSEVHPELNKPDPNAPDRC
jgi:hypothetical protein